MMDYSVYTVDLQILVKDMRLAAADKDWKLVCDLVDKIVDSAQRMKIYACTHEQ